MSTRWPVDAAAQREGIGVYLSQASRTPRLLPAEEITLAQLVEVGVLAREELESGAGRIPAQDLQELVVQGKRAQQRMLEANLLLVVTIAKRYQGRGLELSDLIQEGNLGLMHAIEKFDYRLGYKFSVLAAVWIRQAISVALRDRSRLIRLPAYVDADVRRIWRVELGLLTSASDRARLYETSELLSMSTARVEELKMLARPPVSLDAPTAANSEMAAPLGDLIEDVSSANPADALLATEARDTLYRAMACLPAIERTILEKRYGLVDGQPRSHTWIAKQVGKTRKLVEQLENSALSRLREFCPATDLQDLQLAC